MTIREARKADIPGIVNVHTKAFKGFLMTRLGVRFLATYYEIALSYPDVISLVACGNDEEITGFIVGYYDPGSFYRFFSAKKFRIALSMAGALVRNPFLLPRVLASKAQADTSARDEGYSEGIVELASVAVDPETEGQGIGGRLVRAFIERSSDRGARAIYLTTDLKDNDPALKFYEKNGFTTKKDFVTPTKRQMRQYILNLQSQEGFIHEE